MGLLNVIISPLVGLAKDFTEARKIKKEAQAKVIIAKAEAEATIAIAKANLASKQAEHASNWEITQAQASTTSWKDEYLTIILSAPITISFATILVAMLPDSGPTLERMYTANEQAWVYINMMPEWYQYLLFACVSAVFGLRLTDKFNLFRKGKSNGGQ